MGWKIPDKPQQSRTNHSNYRANPGQFPAVPRKTISHKTRKTDKTDKTDKTEKPRPDGIIENKLLSLHV